MSWKKYFTPVPVGGGNSNFSPVGSAGNPGPARANYASYLPDVYTGSPNRLTQPLIFLLSFAHKKSKMAKVLLT